MQHLEVSCAVRHIYMSLGFKRLNKIFEPNDFQGRQLSVVKHSVRSACLLWKGKVHYLFNEDLILNTILSSMNEYRRNKEMKNRKKEYK